MHALGFNHEQNRPDRDQFIEVHMENVIPSMQHNFDRMKTEDWEDMGEVYDLSSVMHYDGNAFLTQEAANQGVLLTHNLESQKNYYNFLIIYINPIIFSV